jgi:cardiolipin synthase
VASVRGIAFRYLPNAITLVRIALIPVFACFVLAGDRALALSTIALIGFSDWLDGWLARRFGLQTPSGAFLDALADKLAQVTALALLALSTGTHFTRIPRWFFALVLAREVLLVYGAVRVRGSRRRVSIRARWEGKLSTLCVFLIVFASLLGADPSLVLVGALLAAPVVVAAAVRYTMEGRRQLKDGGGP